MNQADGGVSSQPSSDVQDDPAREALAEQLHRWVDETLAANELPPGLAEELETEAGETSGGDLYAVWSALTALSQETRLQGRAFKELTGALAPVAEVTPLMQGLAVAQRQAAEEARASAVQLRDLRRDLVRQAEERVRRESLEALLDVRERLARSIETARAQLGPEPPPASGLRAWLKRVLGAAEAESRSRRAREAAVALEEGARLGLERVEEALRRFGVCRLECLERPFDPESMTAVDVEAVDDPGLDGLVVAIYRNGYTCAGALLRPAQVRVARLTQPSPSGPAAIRPPQGDLQ
jgi:molecular chaperone GrpE